MQTVCFYFKNPNKDWFQHPLLGPCLNRKQEAHPGGSVYWLVDDISYMLFYYLAADSVYTRQGLLFPHPRGTESNIRFSHYSHCDCHQWPLPRHSNRVSFSQCFVKPIIKLLLSLCAAKSCGGSKLVQWAVWRTYQTFYVAQPEPTSWAFPVAISRDSTPACAITTASPTEKKSHGYHLSIDFSYLHFLVIFSRSFLSRMWIQSIWHTIPKS